jgi:hypothetical protein
MRLRALLLGLSFAAAGAASSLAQAPGGSAEAAVRATVDTYLDGLKHNDVASFRKAFWPEAKLFFLKKDKSLGELTQADWYKGFEKSAGKEEEGELRIVSVDVTGPGASVKVEELYPGSKYTDYLSLLQIQGEWKIVNKVYVVEKR